MDPRTPVIVGVAQRSQRPDDLSTALEASALMTACVRDAATDAGAPGLLTELDAVAVVFGAWRYPDPGRLIADEVGSPEARTLLSFHGGNTPQSYVNALASRIQRGDLDVAVITGAETIWTRRRIRREGMERAVTDQHGVEPDERFQSDVSMSTEFEKLRGLEQPINFYPIFESAIRCSNGRTIDQHRTALAELWAGFNQVAVDNPHAWNRTPMTAVEIREAGPSNRMVGFPYTKAMNSNWDLDQGAALLLCSAGAARAAGVPRDRWVFPVAGTDAHDTYAVTNRRDLHSSPAIEAAGARLFELTATGPDDVAHVDLYSCFPSAVQIGAAELGFALDRQLTVTGGLCFAGGPLNNYVSHSIATMVDVLRHDPGSLGLVTANGGYVTKHALGLYSTEPGGPFAVDDVQDVVDAVQDVPGDESFTGRGTIEAATVMHDADGPTKGLAAVTTPAGARTWASTTDLDVMNWLMTDDSTLAPCEVDSSGRLLR
jgi:acetyl-CoA C-acetyltransferase